jgi:soluble lytic murein transglycosylase-like protein
MARGVAASILALTLAAATPLTAFAVVTPQSPAALVLATTPLPIPSFAGSALATASLSLNASATVKFSASATATITLKPAAAKKKKLTVRQTIAKVARAHGLKKSHVEALLWIAKRESNFHRTSVSRSRCYGLFQLSHSMVKGHPWKDAAWNTKRAIKYMRGRYGGVLQAKAFWQRHHWY